MLLSKNEMERHLTTMSVLFLFLFVLLSEMKSNGNNKLAFLSENPEVHPPLDETAACANHFPMHHLSPLRRYTES